MKKQDYYDFIKTIKTGYEFQYTKQDKYQIAKQIIIEAKMPFKYDDKKKTIQRVPCRHYSVNTDRIANARKWMINDLNDGQTFQFSDAESYAICRYIAKGLNVGFERCYICNDEKMTVKKLF